MKDQRGHGTYRYHTGVGAVSGLPSFLPLSLGLLDSSPSVTSEERFLGLCSCDAEWCFFLGSSVG